MNILSLDYGTKRIGVAIATTPLAQPLEVIANGTKKASDIVSAGAIDRILEVVEKNAIEKILVGISEDSMAIKTRQFIEKLSEFTKVAIEEVDETLSSYEASEFMRTMKKSKREGVRDHYAAASILQNYLDLHE